MWKKVLETICSISEHRSADLDGLASALDGEVRAGLAECVDQRIRAGLEVTSRGRRTHRGGDDRGRQHLVQQSDRVAYLVREVHHVAARFRIVAVERDRLAERDERACLVADGVAHHLGDFAAERPRPPLRRRVRQDVILEDDVIRHRERNDDGAVDLRLKRRVQQAGLRRFQFAGIAASTFDVEEQVAALQQLGDVGLQRHQVRRVFRVAPDRNGAGHVAMKQSERSAKKIDAGSGDWRTNPVVVEHQRFDEIVEM